MAVTVVFADSADADISSSDTLAVSGTITCIWSNTGDF